MEEAEELRRKAAEMQDQAFELERQDFERRERIRKAAKEAERRRLAAEMDRQFEYYHRGAFEELARRRPKEPYVAPRLPAWIRAAAAAGFPRSPYTGAVLQFDNGDLPAQPSPTGHITMSDPTNRQAFTVDVSHGLPWKLVSLGRWDW